MRFRFLLLLSVLPLCASAQESPAPLRALFVRLPADEKELDTILDRAQHGGFNTLMVETFYHAQTIYPSSFFPQHAEFRDSRVLPVLINRCKEKDLRVFAWINTLYWRATARGHPTSSELLDRHAEWIDRTNEGATTDQFEKGKQFVSASVPDVRKLLRDLCLELGEHVEVDGIVFDDMRAARDPKRKSHFGCTMAARERFMKTYREDPLTISFPRKDATDEDVARWIRWTAWRENEISTLVYELGAAFREGCRRRGVRGLVAAAVAPEYYRERARSTIVQDWARWCREGYIDVLMPMMSSDTKRGLDEVRARIRDSQVQLAPFFAAREPGLDSYAVVK